MAVSAIYKNLKAGKKGILFSLEMHPDLVWIQFQARYLYEEHGINIKASELIKRTLTEEKERLVQQHDAAFKKFMSGLIIVSEEVLSLAMVITPALFKAFIKKRETKLGGMNFIAFDHVNQFDLMFDGMGNRIIKCIQTTVKTYENNKGNPLVGLMCVQTNREGWLS